MYSSGGTLRSVPGKRRSMMRGDWPEETLEAAVVLLGLVSMLSASNIVLGDSTEADMKWSMMGDIGGGAMI